MAGGQMPFGLAPTGELTSYTPTLRERAADWLRQQLFTDDRAGQDKANRLVSWGETMLPPFGFATGMYDAGNQAGQGNYGTAAMMAGASFIPGPEGKAVEKAGIRAFHGSPHSFDRFDMSKIGTGEGAQAYGHGLYFAENEDIARGYRDALKPGKGMAPEDTASRILDMHGGDREAAISSLSKTIDRAFANDTPYEEVQRLMQAKNILNTQPERAAGSMYEVSINADPNHFLDWDKPLSEQSPEVTAALKKRYGHYYDAIVGGEKKLTGADVGQRVEGPQTASEWVDAGIPGIKYLDAGSRGAGDGTRNYVVFDDKLISIVRKYGIAGASALLGYNVMDGLSNAQADELKKAEGKH